MKRNTARWWAFILAALLLLTALPGGALAQEASPQETGYAYQWGDGETGYALRETQDTLGGGESGFTEAQVFSAPLGSYDDGSFYGQLTARQKACYDALASISLTQILHAAEVDGYRQVQVRVDELYGLTMTGSIRSYVFQPDASSQGLYRSLYTDICAAITALRYDKADALWLSSMRYGITWDSETGSSVTTRNVIFAFRLKYDGQEQAMYDQQMASAQAIAAQVDGSAALYHQVLQIHDILAERATYNYDAVNGQADEKAENLSHQAYSCLIAGDGYEPVCDGYAKAVKVVCDLLDIPCALAISESHMWNNIKMDDGEWYNLDLTWDDEEDRGLRDYFLIGSQTQVGGVAFNSQPAHVERNIWVEDSDLNTVVFRYPAKNPQRYEYREEGYQPLRFPDVKRSSWYYNYVESAASMGLFVGDDQGFFNPRENITRAQFVQVLYNAVAPEDYTPGEITFSDVPAGKWFTSAVVWASELGVVSGYEDGTFRPGNFITREEMCVVLENYRQKVTEAVPEHVDFTFPDDGEISSWASGAVYTSYDLSLISGDEFGCFNPTDNTIRAEAATVFTKYVAMLEDLEEQGLLHEPETEEEPPQEETPGEETPGEETPGEETPGEETPGEETPPESQAPSEEEPPAEGEESAPEEGESTEDGSSSENPAADEEQPESGTSQEPAGDDSSSPEPSAP